VGPGLRVCEDGGSGLAGNLFIAGRDDGGNSGAPGDRPKALHSYIPAGASDAIAGLLLAGFGTLQRVGRETWTPQARRRGRCRGRHGRADRSAGGRSALAGALSINNIGLGFGGRRPPAWVRLRSACRSPAFSVVLLLASENG